MGWFQKGDGKHDQVFIQNGKQNNRHIKCVDKNGKKGDVVSVTYDSKSGKEIGHTTVHGDGTVNNHGSHNDGR